MSKLSSKFLREINKYLNNLNLEKRDLLNFCKCFKQLIALKVHFLPDLFVMMGIFISLQSLNAHFHLVKWKTRSLWKGDRGRKFKRYMLGCPNTLMVLEQEQEWEIDPIDHWWYQCVRRWSWVIQIQLGDKDG